MQPSPQSTVSGLSGGSDISGGSESRGGSELERVLEQLMAIALHLQQPTDWATRLAGAVEGVSALLQGGATTIYRITPEQRATHTATRLAQSKNLDSLEGAIAPCLASGIPSGLASDLASPQMLDLSPYWENLAQGQMVQGQKAQDQDAVPSRGQLLVPITATPCMKASAAVLWGVLVVQRPVTAGDVAWSTAELHALRQVSLQMAIALQQSSLQGEVEQLKCQQAAKLSKVTKSTEATEITEITEITEVTAITEIAHPQPTNEQVRQRELFLRSIYDGVAQGIVVIDVGEDGDFYYAGQNPTAERLTGIANSQIQGKTPEQAFGPERGRSMRQHYQECLQSHGAISYEEELCVEGKVRWGLITLSPLVNIQGQIYRLICTNQDITKRKHNEAKRKQVEQALDRSEARFQHLVSSIPGVIYRSSGDTHRTMEFISEFVEEVSGYPALDFVDDCVRSWTSIIHPDDQAAVSAELAQAIANHQSFTLEYRICHSDGSLRWVYEQGRGVYEPEGAMACLDGVIFDISRIKQTAQRLHDSETFLHAIINGIGDPLFVKDAQHRYLLANDALCEFLGRRREQIIGQTDFDLFSPDEAHILHHADQQVLDACTVQIQEERITDRRGMTKILSAKKSCVCDGSGQSFLIVTIRDITELKHAEMILQHTNEVLEARVEERTIQLRRSENQLRALLSAAPIVLYAIDASGQFTLSEGKGLQAVGRSPGEWVGKSVYDVYAQSPQILEFINRGLAGEQSVALISTDGLWYENYFSPLWNEEGKVDGLIGIALDVTERMQVQQERDRFFELSVDMLCTAGMDGYFKRVNPAFERILGFTPDELMVHPFLEFVHPDDRQATLEEVAKLSRGARTVAFENRYRCKDGSYRWISWTSTALNDLIYATARDITERKLAEAQLREQEQFLRSIYDGIECLIFVANVTDDGDFRYAAYNRYAESLTGLTTADVANKNPEERFGQEGGASVRQAFQSCIDQGIAISKEEFLTIGGQDFWFLTTFNPLRNPDNQIYRIVGTSFDITTLKRTEARLKQQTIDLEKTLQELQYAQMQLVQSEKMSGLGQLVAGVAHEINNPVNFIYGNLSHAHDYIQDLLELLDLYDAHYPNPVAEIQQAVDRIDLPFLVGDLPKLLNSMRVGAERIQKIVASLRTFSRMDEAEMKAVDIHEGIDSTLMILQNRFKARPDRPAVEIIKHYGPLPLIECYAGQLNQVFMNILSNAVDALEDAYALGLTQRPAITIRTAIADSQQVIIQIADNGPGVPEEAKQRLFDPFFTTKPIGKGTGMGLSISYQIITEKHGGSLQCVSQPEEGAVFEISIPIRQE